MNTECIGRRWQLHQWWKSLSPVWISVMPYSLHASITSSSLVEPPGLATYFTPNCRYRYSSMLTCRLNTPRTKHKESLTTNGDIFLWLRGTYKLRPDRALIESFSTAPSCNRILHIRKNEPSPTAHRWWLSLSHQILPSITSTGNGWRNPVWESDSTVWILLSEPLVYIIT